MDKENIISFKARIHHTQTLTNGDKRIYIDVDKDDKPIIADLDCMTEADGVMVAVGISPIDIL
jgi:hypothetical protein